MFDNITPEDFFRETSAKSTQTHPDGLANLGLTQGKAGFSLFVELMLQQCRDQAASDDEFEPFAMLHSKEFERYFRADDDEAPVDFASRLKRESDSMGAVWVFAAMTAPARVVTPGTDAATIDADDLEAVQDAIFNGDLDLCICWTATFLEDGLEMHRGGVMYLDDDGSVASEFEGHLDPDSDPFHSVLG